MTGLPSARLSLARQITNSVDWARERRIPCVPGFKRFPLFFFSSFLRRIPTTGARMYSYRNWSSQICSSHTACWPRRGGPAPATEKALHLALCLGILILLDVECFATE